MEPTLFRYIFKHSLRQQILLLILTGISFPFLYMTLDLPKTIINKAIGPSQWVPKMIAPTVFGHELFHVELAQVQYLVMLCVAFLVLVFVNGGFKYWINVFKGQLGERMLRRLRYDLFSRVLRFPLPHFRRVSQGEIIAMITGEGEALGGFFGDALAWPAFQGGTLLTILAFMFVQDWILGIAAISLYPVQMYVIPKLQRRVNLLGKERIRTVRKLAERIGENVSGVQEIHAHDTSELELADFSSRVGRIYDIRYNIYRKKFFIKFLNNFLAQLTPFFFYSVGGYLVISGSITFGALVAILAAYKDLSGPWKELLNYYQMRADAQIKYEQLVEQFQPTDMLDEALQREEPEAFPDLSGTIVATNLVLEEEGGFRMVDGANFSLGGTERTAIVGASGAGRAGIAQLLARLLRPTSGSIRVGEVNFASLPEAVTGRRIAYVDENAFLFSGTVADNLYYGLKHRPLKPAGYEDAARQEYERYASEALAAGNTPSDLGADWIDYEAVGVSGADELVGRTLEVLRAVDLEDSVYRFGLGGTVDPGKRPDLAGRILEARAELRQRLEQNEALARLVEPFDEATYNANMTVAENLLFGTPIGDAFDLEHLAANAYVQSILEKAGLTRDFLETGSKVASITVELFQGLPSDHEYFERFSFISSEDLPDYQVLVRKRESVGLDGLEEDERYKLMSLPFLLIPARHRLGLISDELQAKVLAARKLFADELPPTLRPSVAFFDRAEYSPASSVQDNILFGRLVYGRQSAEQEVGQLIGDVVDTLGMRRSLIEIGLGSSVGIGGGRLTTSQRQRVAIARCLLKRPDILVVNGATGALAPAAQQLVMKNVFEAMKGRGVVWVLNQIDHIREFDRAIVVESGKVSEQGKIADLDRSDGWLKRAAAAE